MVVIIGGAGDDKLVGTGFDDEIDGGAGDDDVRHGRAKRKISSTSSDR